MNARDSDWQQTLDAIAGRIVPGARATGIARVSGGASQAIWAFDAESADACEPLIMRLAGAWNEADELGALDLDTEAGVVDAVARCGVPVPGVRLRLLPDDGLGAGYVMDRIDGETIPRRILRDAEYASAREVLATQCGDVLARIHAVSTGSLPAAVPRPDIATQIDDQYAEYRAQGMARPVFEYAFRWLRENRPPDPDVPVLLHGDFRNGNFVVGAEGLRAVLDWEVAHVGDPMEDVGWICVNSWRFGNMDQPVGGFGDRESFYAAYRAAGGAPVDRERIHYWEVYGTLRWGVICGSMARAYREGRDRSVERAAIGRRASETAIDLLRLLVPIRSA